jgi:hypothetical protein
MLRHNSDLNVMPRLRWRLAWALGVMLAVCGASPPSVAQIVEEAPSLPEDLHLPGLNQPVRPRTRVQSYLNDLETANEVNPSTPLLTDSIHAAVETESEFGPEAFPSLCDGFKCPPTWDIRLEGLAMLRAGQSGPQLSTGFQLGEFGYRDAGRVKLNYRKDCLNGWEFIATGPLRSFESDSLDATGIRSVFSSNAFNLSAFNDDVVSQSLSWRSQYHSFEVNRRFWGWNVISTYAGLRYINIDDDLLFYSRNAADETGLLAVRTDNFLGGAQIGVDLYFPLGRWTAEAIFKGGPYAAGTESTFLLMNAGQQQSPTFDEKVRLSGVGEFALNISYAITPRTRLRMGYEFWYVYGLATAPGQLHTFITPNTGRVNNNETELIYHGAMVGIERTW